MSSIAPLLSNKVLMQSYSKLSNWAKLLLFATLWLAVLGLARAWGLRKNGVDRDGFRAQQGDKDLIVKSGPDIYDTFYAGVYDNLF